jgi:predicted phosphodiesterase
MASVVRSYRRSVLLSDPHAPYTDARAVHATVAFVRHVKPQVIVWLGDVCDFYQLSKFDKNPLRMNSLQEDLDRAEVLLQTVRDAAPNAEIHFLEGNHDQRIQRYLWHDAPPMSGLRNLLLQNLLNLDRMKVEYHSPGRMLLGPLQLKHGDVVRARSGASAHVELERAWVSGASAHTHRLGQVYLRNDGGEWTWAECGCLCQLDAEYLRGATANWQHGLGYAEVADDRYYLTTLPILSGKIVWGAREIGSPAVSEVIENCSESAPDGNKP